MLARMTRRHFFHLKEWYESYLEALEQQPDKIVFCVVYDDNDHDAPAALLPLREEVHAVAGVRVRTLELPRHDALHLRDVLISDAARQRLSLAELTELLRRSGELEWDVLALWHCMEDSCVMAAHKLQAPSWNICTRRFGCSHVGLEPWEELSKKLSKSFRQNLRTANNRARDIEGLKFEMSNTMPELESALAAFLKVEGSGWKAERGTAIKLDEHFKCFWEEIIQRFGPQGGCEIHLLRAADRPIGGLLLLVTDDIVYLPKVGYDEEYARISPVQLLLENLFKQCEKRTELKELNLTSDAPWFEVWKPRRSSVYNVYVFNKTVMGMAVGAAMGLAEKWRTSKRRAGAASETPTSGGSSHAADGPPH